MKINLDYPNPALISIIQNPDQIITLDANFLIPPDRTPLTKKSIGFKQFNQIWLDPIFNVFRKLAIHEAVYDELVGLSAKNYIDSKKKCIPPQIIIHRDSSLTEAEKVIRETIESRIASHTRYEPVLNNRDDRGEVKSLSYIAVKNLLYFAANDNNAIQLIEKSEAWSTGLDNVQAIKMYEIMYYLYKRDAADKTAMKMLYKYLYYLTESEKKSNPNWVNFFTSMDGFCKQYFK